MNPQKTAAIYCRYSTDRQDARSIDDQLRRCRAFAEAKGLKVVAEFKDAAVSGAHLERLDMQRLLKEAQRRQGSPFSVVLVDDLSRLSRDLGNTWRIVFEDLAAVRVNVLDCNTGVSSDATGARLTFGAMALVNDTFLQLVKTETHRGLEGRALAGFSTGGRCYGYSTIAEEAPQDAEHPRKVIIIDEAEAEVVRRIFRMYADGTGLKAIASRFNHEGIRAPYEDVKGNRKHGRGWAHTSIRAMLRNERYIGVFVWNKRQFIRVAGQKNRRAVERPPSEWTKRTVPELAIIDQELWDRCQARHRTIKTGRPPPSSKVAYLVSGLLKCGTCGGAMGIVGANLKAGVRYTSFGCLTHHSRGSAVCANNRTISERRASEAIVNALRDTLLEPGLVARFVHKVQARLRELARAPKPVSSIEAEISEARRRIANLGDALARIGWSDALGEQLRNEEARLATLRAQQKTERKPKPEVIAPHPAAIEATLRELLGTLDKDAAKGRDWLKRTLGHALLEPAEVEGVPGFRMTTGFGFDLTAPLVSLQVGGSALENGPCAPPQFWLAHTSAIVSSRR